MPVLSVTQDKGVIKRSDINIDIKYDPSTLSNYKLIKPSDFVISLRSFQGGFELSDIEGIISPAYTVFEFKSPKINNNYFWKAKFKTYKFIQSLKTITFGIRDGKSISFSEFKSLKLNYSNNFIEQKKIGSLLQKIEDLIDLQQRQLTLYIELKKSLLQKMFPYDNKNIPIIRFEDYVDNWMKIELKHISKKRIEKNKQNQYTETFTNSAENGIISQKSFFDKNISNKHNLNNYYVVHQNDFVYNPRISKLAPVGPIKRNKLKRVGVMSPLYYVFKVHDINPTYLEFYFETTKWNRFLKLNGDSGVRSDRISIKDSVFQEMPVPLPDLREQYAISSLLEKYDNLVKFQKMNLKHIKNLKEYYLQKLFI